MKIIKLNQVTSFLPEVKVQRDLEKEKRYNCYLLTCDYKKTTKRIFRDKFHHINLNSYKFLMCGFCTRLRNLVAHKLSHQTEQLYKCSKCPYQTSRKVRFSDHQLSHSNAKLFKCQQKHCTFETKHKHNIDRHILLFHSN